MARLAAHATAPNLRTNPRYTTTILLYLLYYLPTHGPLVK